MYHIKGLFRRAYHFACSSSNCPSREGCISNQTDIVDDMTLHTPPSMKGDCHALVTESIKMWELGTGMRGNQLQ